MSEPLIWLRGDRAGIGPLRADLVEEYWRWEQSIPTIVGYNRQTPQPVESTRDILLEGYARASDRELRFTVYGLTGQEPRPVGLAQVYIDQMRRNGEYVVALGESRGKGVGTEATRLVLDYAFHVTNLRCVYLTVLAPNTGAIRAYEKAGFKRQGVRRNSNQWLGETVDEVLMDAIPEEFEGSSLVKAQFQR
ncbi:GNAT family protein [Nocardiopsis sp. N85]|uniref:GNAT family N-acetyltransferase n=1 Tax=Nocardiopsis sp. N85 TaxID=3029400 RepID=UPI00237F7986|nr:GNAT family protein [Nocardiopsis sp. N85]MDE3724849.1 GNAT family protein [Nocardiopsis sp. N85]